MPLYEYQCLDCSDTFEARRPFAQSDKPASCPSCDSQQTRKMFGMIALVGTGSQMISEPISDSAQNYHGCACGHGGCGCSG